MVSGFNFFISITVSGSKACCHSEALPQALIVALYDTRSACIDRNPMAANKAKAPSQWLAFSQTLMVALKLMTLGVINWCWASLSSCKDCCHCWLFLHETMALVRSTIDQADPMLGEFMAELEPLSQQEKSRRFQDQLSVKLKFVGNSKLFVQVS